MKETIREFNTQNFRVSVEALPEYDLDLSWDETGEVLEKLENGEFIAFCAKASVTHKETGEELATDYLGGCIYKSLEDFADHIEAARYTRKLRAEGSNAVCGSYFADMVKTVCKETREELKKRAQVYSQIHVRG